MRIKPLSKYRVTSTCRAYGPTRTNPNALEESRQQPICFERPESGRRSASISAPTRISPEVGMWQSWATRYGRADMAVMQA